MVGPHCIRNTNYSPTLARSRTRQLSLVIACSLPVYTSPRCCNPALNRMVTIGPLIVLGLLGATFNFGARQLKPVATDVPICRQAFSRYQRGMDGFQTTEPPRSGSLLRGKKTSDASEDTLALARNQRRSRAAGVSTGQNRTAAVTSELSLLSRNGNSTTAGAIADKHRPAGGDRESPGTHRPLPNSGDATADGQTNVMAHRLVEGEVEALPDCSVSTERKERSSDPQQVNKIAVWLLVTLNLRTTFSYMFSPGVFLFIATAPFCMYKLRIWA